MMRALTVKHLAAAVAAVSVLSQAAMPSSASARAAGAAGASVNYLSEGVAAVVNDSIISTYDLRQRMLLLIVTSGMQPTADSLGQIERESLRSLVDEALQMQELRRQQRAALRQVVLQPLLLGAEEPFEVGGVAAVLAALRELAAV